MRAAPGVGQSSIENMSDPGRTELDHAELDHLIVAGPDLTAMTAWLESETGLVAAPGGRHPDQGTHNALVGLGADAYLELMAPDPSGAVDGTYRRTVSHLNEPELLTWCARTPDSATLAERATALGLNIDALDGSRRTQSGTELRWSLTILGGHGFGGHVPFFIDWLDTPHPALSMPRQAALIELRLEHPDPIGLANLLGALGVEPSAAPLHTAWSSEPKLSASLATSGGVRTLVGAGGGLRPV